MFKGWGYPVGDTESETPIELREMTLTADAAHVRAVGEFLLETAALMEQHGRGFGHRHLQDVRKDLWRPGFVDVIVERPRAPDEA
jgi:hypothetical protein